MSSAFSLNNLLKRIRKKQDKANSKEIPADNSNWYARFFDAKDDVFLERFKGVDEVYKPFKHVAEVVKWKLIFVYNFQLVAGSDEDDINLVLQQRQFVFSVIFDTIQASPQILRRLEQLEEFFCYRENDDSVLIFRDIFFCIYGTVIVDITKLQEEAGGDETIERMQKLYEEHQQRRSV